MENTNLEENLEKNNDESKKEKFSEDIAIRVIIFMDIDMEKEASNGLTILTDKGKEYYKNIILENIKGYNIDISLSEIEPKKITSKYPLPLLEDSRYDQFLIKTIEANSEEYLIPGIKDHIIIANATIPSKLDLSNVYITDEDYEYNEILEYKIPLSYIHPTKTIVNELTGRG